MTLVALGAIGGFGIFHSALQHRIEQTEYSHNATLAIVTGRFAESEIERNRCIETDSGRLQEISELRGRLDAQYKSWYDLSAAQRSMLSEQRESKAQIQQFREVFGRDQRTLASLRAESDQKSRDLTSIQEDLAVARANLETYHRANAELETELTKLREAKKEETNDLQFQVKGKDLELENALENLDRIAQQNDQLKMENQELQLEIRQKDEELDTLQENSDALLTQKKKLEQHVAEMSDEMEKLSSQIVEKEKELSEYREEEGELEIKLTNFRDGMLVLLEEKVNEIQDLEHRIDSLNEEKADLEKKLDHWRDGMLKLLKEKIEEIEGLKLVLAESRKSMNHMMHEIELARSEQVEAEKFVRERLDTLDHSNSDPEEKEMIKELLQEIERVRAELRESQEWVVSATKDIEHRQSDQVKSEALILDKTNEIKNLKLRIERDQNSAKEEISKLELDLAEARKLVEEKTNQVEHLSSELKNFVVEINELKSVLAGASIDQNDMLGSPTTEMMIDHIQQRDGVVCRQL
jgi:chromosome segregation ATPase